MNETNYRRYGRLKDETHFCMMGIVEELLSKADRDPDSVRTVLGSVSFRKLEEYRSLRDQKDAAFEEWVHEISAIEKPFG